MPTRKQLRVVEPTRFAMVPRNDIPRSAFDISFTHKTTLSAGFLVPLYVDEVLPGDTFRVRMTAFARLATPIVPVMDNLILESFFFFCPNRLVWYNWQRFMGEKNSITDTTEFLTPQVTFNAGQVNVGTLPDYFGLTNPSGANTLTVNVLPFRMYKLIYNEWFRDEDLISPVNVPSDEATEAGATNVNLFRRGKRFDYFTSCRPWPQKPSNSSAIMAMDGALIPGGGMIFPQSGAPVTGLGIFGGPTPGASPPVREAGGRTETWPVNAFASTDLVIKASPENIFPDVRVLINDIRTANQVQLLLERNARGGTRYTELVRSHFGVVSPDLRLQRPEFLGGGRAHVTVNPVGQTSATGITGGSTVLGELAGVGSAIADAHGFTQSFTEHGFIIGMVNIRADLSYQQGVNRMWFRRSMFDYYFPATAHLGEQAVLSREIFADGSAGDTDVFGYQERWAEYKYKPSMVTGLFRSTHATPIDFWHFAQEFAVRPVLNETFIQEDPPVARVLQVDSPSTDGEQFLVDALFDIRKASAMPMFSIPGIGPRL